MTTLLVFSFYIENKLAELFVSKCSIDLSAFLFGYNWS